MSPTLQSVASKAVASFTQSAKAFSTTASRHNTKIPPEAPAYLNVPKPPLNQSDEVDNRPKPLEYKGKLPVPRRIFKRQGPELPKTDPRFLKQSAPEPSNEKSKREPVHEYEAWKRRMAESRRKNLEEGVKQLWTRKQETEAEKLDHDTKKIAYHDRQRDAPQREDERLTESSIPAVLLQTAVPRDPLRFEKARSSRSRTKGIMKMKSQKRKDALQHLYMNARSFIVEEDELNKEIERLFSPSAFKSNSYSPFASNAWGLWGAPPRVSDMMRSQTGVDNRAVTSTVTDETITHHRQKLIAEELTGGPTDKPN